MLAQTLHEIVALDPKYVRHDDAARDRDQQCFEVEEPGDLGSQERQRDKSDQRPASREVQVACHPHPEQGAGGGRAAEAPQ